MADAGILIVEDEYIVALDLGNELRRLGYTVCGVARSGLEAIRKAEDAQPDLVLMDIKLEGAMDGVEAAERVRTQLDLPVVFLTAYADEATLERVKSSEPFGYLLKPYEGRDLRVTIETALYKHAMERTLREREERFRALIENSSDLIVVLDRSGVMRYVSPALCRVLGYATEEAIGTSAFAFIHPDDRPTAMDSFSQLVQDPTMLWSREGRFRHRDGSYRVLEVIGQNRLDDPAVMGIVVNARDVTERHRAQEALRAYAAELEARNEDLDAFAHTVAHDLKSPLSFIIGYGEILREDWATPATAPQRQHLETILRHGRKMNSIIDNLLLLASVSKMDVDLAPLDMASIVAEAQERLARVIEDHEARITLPDGWPVALGYGPWIEAVWVNYLSNAVKYGGRPPRVELGADVGEEAGLANGTVRFWVRDNGPGLTEAEQERLFTPFRQLERMRAEGYGLGLSIAQGILEKLGGTVGVESEVGAGSSFFFTLPLVDPQ